MTPQCSVRVRDTVLLYKLLWNQDSSHNVMQARANRGILYVDEVNLLDDGLVDVVLDSSASGVNTVEREGVGIVHPAKFIMIGSGNPQVKLRVADSCDSCPHDACTLVSILHATKFHVLGSGSIIRLLRAPGVLLD